MKALRTLLAVLLLVTPALALADPPGQLVKVTEGEPAPFTGALADRDRTAWFLQVIDERDDYWGQLGILTVELAQTQKTLEAQETAYAELLKAQEKERKAQTIGKVFMVIGFVALFGAGMGLGSTIK